MRNLLQKLKWQVHKIKRQVKFYKRFFEVRTLLADGRFECSWRDLYPCINDATQSTGFDAHYIYHTAWAARVLAELRPATHVDISSWLPFVSEVSAFIPVDFYDYRPAALHLSGLSCKHGDILHLPFADRSIPSLSSMHVVEHIGLERYGDPFDPQGDLKAMKELQRVLAPDGHLLFVVPVGKNRIYYNAQRVLSYEMILSAFNELTVQQFALVTDKGHFIEHSSQSEADEQNYGCGCFHFRR